jgi:hypothetical protein
MVNQARFKLGAAVCCFAIGQLVSAPIAGAWVDAGSCQIYDPGNFSDGLGIGISSTNSETTRVTATNNGGARWNSAMSGAGKPGVYYTIVSYGSSTQDLEVVFTNQGANSTNAVTTTYCTIFSGSHYSADPYFQWNLQSNSSPPSGQSATQARSVTAVHEMAHAFGLNHAPTGFCPPSGSAAIVASGSWPYYNCSTRPSNPLPDDVAGAVAKTP